MGDACKGSELSATADVVHEDVAVAELTVVQRSPTISTLVVSAAVEIEGLSSASSSRSPMQGTPVSDVLACSTTGQNCPEQSPPSMSSPIQATAATGDADASQAQQCLHSRELDTETDDRTAAPTSPAVLATHSSSPASQRSLTPCSQSQPDDRPQPPKRLTVHVYRDVGTWLGWLSRCAYHTEVHFAGEEWTFTATDGICRDPIGTFKPPRGLNHYKEVDMGWVAMPRPAALKEQQDRELKIKFQQSTYGMFQCNCNHFARHLCLMLGGREPPGWINRPARLIATCLFLRFFSPITPPKTSTPLPPQNNLQQPHAQKPSPAPMTTTPAPNNRPSHYLPPPLVLGGAPPAFASQDPATASSLVEHTPCLPLATAASRQDMLPALDSLPSLPPAPVLPHLPSPPHITPPVVSETALLTQLANSQKDTPAATPHAPDPPATHKSTGRHRPKWFKKCVSALAKIFCLPHEGKVKGEDRSK